MSRSILLSCESITKSFGVRPLFQDLTFGIFDGDRVGIIGPNGSGKSTLLKILAGTEVPDKGSRTMRKNIVVGYVPQDPQFEAGQTLEDIVAGGLTDAHMDEYEKSTAASIALGRAGFEDQTLTVDVLSGGWRKRLAIARELVKKPDVLLMDEPTNHLDVEGILWLEQVLKSEASAYVVVSHDRYFLENVTRRMIELNRVYPEGLFESSGNYSAFLVKRDEALAAQSAYQDTLANKVRREIEWLQRGPKARTTKSKARIDSAGKLIGELADSRSRTATSLASIEFTASDRKTKRLWTGRNLSKSFGSKKIFSNLDLALAPGMRLGFLGPNGSGKSTLLQIVAGRLESDSGEVESADQLRVVLFDQHRATIDPDISLRRALAPDTDSVIFGDRLVHVASWAKRFLFRGEQLETAVGKLSGGEQARVVLARLMLQPADLLILDEPTNDLDIPTLEVLEENLLEFPGALILVTHDRYLLDRVSTQILALDGEGGSEYFSDYDQWESAPKHYAIKQKQPAPAPAQKSGGKSSKKLSYKEQREWDALEKKLGDAEGSLAAAKKAVEDPRVASDPAELQKRFTTLQERQAAVDTHFARWAELEAKQK